MKLLEELNLSTDILELPAFKFKPSIEKTELDFLKQFEIAWDSLKEGQAEAARMIVSYIKGELNQQDVEALLILGYAGTGKTFTITEIIKWLAIQMNYNVIVTAPTNKAVKILKDSADYTHPRIDYMTCHRMLGLKPEHDQKTGRLLFTRSKNPEEQAETLNSRTVVIVDETSMFPDELFHYLYPEIKENGIKLIFLGDPAQIPPVNKLDCIPFQLNKRHQYGIATSELTEIVRQAADNPVLAFATHLRSNLTMPVESPRESHVVNKAGIIAISKHNKGLIREVCKTYFDTPHFEHNPDFMKVIAWRNKVVDAVNYVVRTLIYKQENLPKLMVGEKLIADSPIIDPASALQRHKWLLLNTNDEMEVLSAEEATTTVENFPIHYYRTSIKYLNNDGQEKVGIIHIIHENSEKAWQEVLDLIKGYALRAPYDKRGYFWKAYFEKKEMFAEVKYNYAITAHKAQGSTYDHTMVVDWDMCENSRIVERNRIRYVAFTRPKNYLFSIYN